jgi:hypothetical protein
MEPIAFGYQAYTEDGADPFGAVREVREDVIVVYVENAGDFEIPREAVAAVHAQKVVVDCRKLESRLREAIDHAHDAEEPGL